MRIESKVGGIDWISLKSTCFKDYHRTILPILREDGHTHVGVYLQYPSPRVETIKMNDEDTVNVEFCQCVPETPSRKQVSIDRLPVRVLIGSNHKIMTNVIMHCLSPSNMSHNIMLTSIIARARTPQYFVVLWADTSPVELVSCLLGEDGSVYQISSRVIK